MSIADGIPDRVNGQTVDQSWWNDIKTVLNAYVFGIENVLVSFVVGANSTVTNTDTIVGGFGKVQGQINNIVSTFAATVRATVLTGLSLTTVSAITAADTVLSALGKLQSQFNTKFEAVVTTGLTNSSNVTFTNITALQFPVVSGRKYKIECVIRFQTVAAGTGIALTINTPDTATGALTLLMNAILTSGGASALYSAPITALGVAATSTAVDTANTDYIATLVGTFIATASGNLVPQFHSEVNTNQVTLQPGTNIQAREFT